MRNLKALPNVAPAGLRADGIDCPWADAHGCTTGSLRDHLSHFARREFLRRSGLGLGAFALSELLAERTSAAERSTTSLAAAKPFATDPSAARPSHHAPRAKHVIYLHMVGAPSQLDLFEHKPTLTKHHGEPCPPEFIEGKRFAFLRGHPKLMGSPFKFSRQGASGHELSELLPHLAGVADNLAFIKTVRTDEFNHGPAQLCLQTGFGRLGRPGLGAWLTYGLGSEASDLPAFVVMVTGLTPGAGTSLWSAGFLPSVHQGVQFRSSGDPVLFLNNPPGQSRDDRRRVLNTLGALNREQLADVGDPEIATRIEQYEMAFRMQTAVPDLMDLSHETRPTLEMYGAAPGQASFANNCLLARRLVERGVRIVQLYDEGWDHHSNIATGLPNKCRQVDRPIAALIRDLKQRGLLDETLVVWGGEFGRTPMQQTDSGDGASTKAGRDHQKDAFTMWLAGGGTRAGVTVGRTDDLGYNIVETPVHVHDLNATILHLLGIDHERLTFKYQGRDFRLTDVHGRVVPELLA
ncbi:MAG: DUF1501 domain-containing protein [Planctomycetales bacterium]|nr:DUF1501 domain-containing protein [Planctomycetales bacterium]